MLDLAFIREHPDLIKEVARRRKTAVDVDALLAIDSELRNVRRQAEEQRAEQNRLSKAIREAGADQEARDGFIAAGARPSPPRSKSLSRANASWRRVCASSGCSCRISPTPACPKARARTTTSRSSAVGAPRRFDFEPLDHVTLMRGQDWLDLERGSEGRGVAQLYPQGRGGAAGAGADAVRARPRRRARASCRCWCRRWPRSSASSAIASSHAGASRPTRCEADELYPGRHR